MAKINLLSFLSLTKNFWLILASFNNAANRDVITLSEPKVAQKVTKYLCYICEIICHQHFLKNTQSSHTAIRSDVSIDQ